MFDKGRQLFWTANAFHLFNVWWWNRVSKRWAKLATAYIRSKTPPLSFLKSFFFGFPSQLVPFFFWEQRTKMMRKKVHTLSRLSNVIKYKGRKRKERERGYSHFRVLFLFQKGLYQTLRQRGEHTKNDGSFSMWNKRSCSCFRHF